MYAKKDVAHKIFLHGKILCIFVKSYSFVPRKHIKVIFYRILESFVSLKLFIFGNSENGTHSALHGVTWKADKTCPFIDED